MFYDRLYLLLAEITDQHYSTQLLGGSSSSSSSASSNNSKLSVLQCDRLALYLEQVPLPNVEQPLSSAEAEFVLESIPKDDGGQVSREHFRKWFDLSTSSEEKVGAQISSFTAMIKILCFVLLTHYLLTGRKWTG